MSDTHNVLQYEQISAKKNKIVKSIRVKCIIC